VSFTQYEDAAGLKLPRKISTKTDKWNTGELLVTKSTVDGDVGELAAPDAIKSSPLPPAPAAVVVTAEPVGKGI
jgi:hypothetical protein